MELRPYRLPGDVLSRLAAGGGGAEGARHLAAAEDSKHRGLLMALLGLAGTGAVERAFDVLAAVEKRDPAAVEGVLRYPAVGAWANRAVYRLKRGIRDPLEPAQLGAVAAAAAIEAGVACETPVPVRQGRIMLPSLGRITLPGGGSELVTLRVGPGRTVEVGGVRLRAGAAGRPGWEPLHRIGSGRRRLIVDDLDPCRWDPGKVVEGRLSPDELRHWQDCLTAAWRMLTGHHWTVAQEVAAIIPVLVPIKGPARGQDSASDGARFGAVAMSTPPDGRWLAATFAHEVQHAKLGAVLDTVHLVRPEVRTRDERVHYAPWRDDPRPLSGLLHGAYAYLGVAGFWRRQRAHEPDLRPHVEFARWRRSAFEVTGTLLADGGLTPPGEEFVAAMRRTLSAWLDEPVPAAAAAEARRLSAAHREAWTARNGLTG
ncbi:HEXXH motif domain-containing protein [Planomonospora venezuelensis]|uniref:HEXXH motif-containing protein n=1 Tax=Planomonospora venezuelensis TaxID=1999 RepID=A0A841D636_PLAVE|nr:HEXXH motif domain-containing protein [Planomonospora venezuelensis]MBB5963605.1 HEXXH motif-containing protein [Planomonospora venezuelensis]GIN01393.1 HEXXH motif domain-containing protein [Planomonospora venezuelensis]